MDKASLVKHIIQEIENELTTLKAAAQETYEAAIGEESRPENEYDTRALEASYLAGAQSKRVLETETALKIFKRLELKTFNSESRIESTALVEVHLAEKPLHVFIVPVMGTLSTKFESITIQLITAQSPLGEALLGLRVGDTARVDKGDRQLEYEIISVQ